MADDMILAQIGSIENWILSEAWRITATTELIKAFCHRLRDADIPIERLNCHIPFLDPQVVGVSYVWDAATDTVNERPVPFEMRQTPTFRDNPMSQIIGGQVPMLRRELTGEKARLDFPILSELAEAGSTGYVIFAIPFSNRAINALSLATAGPGGFSDDQVAAIEHLLPFVGRILEVHALRHLTTSLLDTYVGRGTGRQVLNGQIRRGDFTTIDAIIWFSDLRNSTRLAAALSPQDFLGVLNTSFDATAGSVIAAGGEVLKFIGDAVLAIFPIEGDPQTAVLAANNALASARRSLAAINVARQEEGRESIACGVALHRGVVMYGNVGVPSRLDFTVTGTAVNTAARIQELCKELGEVVLCSGDVARLVPTAFELIGPRKLRSVEEELEIWRPRLD
ncbi:adenylate cyclase /adenylate/guanylate cyclase [Rhizobiales bacterium GAS113]|nr:adenylate cyclase /adenylate/guanylate cyclase [Rhizobiales bacterium GAS113]SEE53157.1 adenylate cyclase /adenylate/guanylate cyclase [Rhizobiales bacterium GAS188]